MRIVILGAGYAGLVLAQRLDWWLGAGSDHAITLVDRHPYHTLVVRLHEVAALSIPPEEASVPIAHLLRGRRVRFHQGDVTGWDTRARQVFTDSGALPYDALVVALGGATEDFGLPGVRAHAFTLKDLPDALRLRRQVTGQVVRAGKESDPERRAARLTFVVGGGGYTGTELAGELADGIRDLMVLHEVEGTPRILLLEARDQLLPGYPTDLATRAREVLMANGVEVRLGTPVAGAAPGTVHLPAGEAIRAETFVWVGGVRANPVVAASDLPKGHGDRVRVDAFLRGDGDALYVIGDASLVARPEGDGFLAPSAQLALQQAEHLALNLYRAAQGRPPHPFQPHPTADVISLGRREALARVGPARFQGSAARRLKNLSYWRYLRAVGGWPPPATVSDVVAP